MPHNISDTVARGMCIGCGTCSVATDGAIPLVLTRRGLYSAVLDGVAEQDLERASRVCPFSDDAPDEDELGAPTPEGNALPLDPRLGHHGRVLAGRHRSDDYLLGSSSGGLTSWLLDQLLQRELVDAVIHVGRADADDALFQYTITTTSSSVTAQRKSQYYPTTLRDVLDVARQDGRRYALVGVPCFIKAARQLCREDDRLRESIRFFVGLVCGHMKSRFFAESLAWQVGVPPEQLAAVDFRVKNPARASSDYDFAATARGDGVVQRRTRALVGGNWGHGAFQPEACNFCDDVFAETADVVFGDAWLPQYAADWRGTNIVVTRNPIVDEILSAGAAAGDIELEPLTVDEAARSQAGGLRHRRDGLAVRLADDLAAGLSVPVKRVRPDASAVDANRLALVRQRRRMSQMSLDWFASARAQHDLAVYVRPMSAAIARYRRLEVGGLLTGLLTRLRPRRR